jgi:hypothetical protein
MWFHRANAGAEIEALLEEPQPKEPSAEAAQVQVRKGQELLLEADKLATAIYGGGEAAGEEMG